MTSIKTSTTTQGLDEEQCVICLELLNEAVELPCCRHSFCSSCLELWQSEGSHLRCPTCRQPLAPAKQMLQRLDNVTEVCRGLKGILNRPEPLPVPKRSCCDTDDLKASTIANELSDETLKQIRFLDDDPEGQQELLRTIAQSKLKGFLREKEEIEQAVESTSTKKSDPVEDLPVDIVRAAIGEDVQTVVAWLRNGQPATKPIPAKRINAQWEGLTLLHLAARDNSVGLMSILLQNGAKVDANVGLGSTPFEQCHPTRDQEASRLLLTWGASIDPVNTNERVMHRSKMSFLALLETPLGGRRCEVVGLKERSDLNGKKGVTTTYLPEEEQFVFVVEWTKEEVKIGTSNLIRCDRTADDPGIYCHFQSSTSIGKRGVFSHSVAFLSKEEMEECARYRQERKEQERKGLEDSDSQNQEGKELGDSDKENNCQEGNELGESDNRS